MIQHDFVKKLLPILKEDDEVIGVAAGGSWINNELDEFSDLDLIIVTKSKMGGDRKLMLNFAQKCGTLLSGFTGEHVGEPRLLICLYENPLLHVDLKFLTLNELTPRVEDPHVLLDKEQQITHVLSNSTAAFPYPDSQGIEDRFWTWIHYALTKIGRGEYLEAYDFLGFLRTVVLGPLLHIKNGSLPRGVRKAESILSEEDFGALKQTLASYNRASLLRSLRKAVDLYETLRDQMFPPNIHMQDSARRSVLRYFENMERRSKPM